MSKYAASFELPSHLGTVTEVMRAFENVSSDCAL
jgi:hypothetical protein